MPSWFDVIPSIPLNNYAKFITVIILGGVGTVMNGSVSYHLPSYDLLQFKVNLDCDQCKEERLLTMSCSVVSHSISLCVAILSLFSIHLVS